MIDSCVKDKDIKLGVGTRPNVAEHRILNPPLTTHPVWFLAEQQNSSYNIPSSSSSLGRAARLSSRAELPPHRWNGQHYQYHDVSILPISSDQARCGIHSKQVHARILK